MPVGPRPPGPLALALGVALGAGSCMSRLDPDGDGLKLAEDCADLDPDLGRPGDCYTDADGDGYGRSKSAPACTCPAGESPLAGDCDDDAPATYPDAEEICFDGLINDCSGEPAPDDGCLPAAVALADDDLSQLGGALLVGGAADGAYGSAVAFALSGLLTTAPEAGALLAYSLARAGGAPQATSDRSWTLAEGTALTLVAVPRVQGVPWLLVGAPALGDGGVVLVLSPAERGGVLTASPHRVVTGRSGDQVGAALATGDLDGDGIPELAVGAPTSSDDGGQVSLLWGDEVDLWSEEEEPADLSLADAGLLAGVAGTRLGEALAIGDLNGDGLGDLAVGAPGGSGLVLLLWGDRDHGALISDPSTVSGVGDEGLGSALAAAREDASADRDSLMVGAPLAEAQAGAVILLREDNWVSYNYPFINGEQAGDQLGAALAWGPDLDGDGRRAALIGAPGAAAEAGAAYAMDWPDGGGGRSLATCQRLKLSGAAAGDRLGAALASGPDDFADPDEAWDLLAFGAPGYGDGGAVILLRADPW